jgi:hypothetical protein
MELKEVLASNVPFFFLIIPSTDMAAKSSSYASKTEILQDCMAALKVGKMTLAGQLLRQQRGEEPWPITV